MPSRVSSAILQGIHATQVDIEVDVLAGLPSYTVVGLGDTAIKESKERMASALTNSGFTPPRRKTIVSMAPASLKKVGSLYDVPITLGFLIASRQIELTPQATDNIWFIGELGLDGSIRPVTGALPVALAAIKSGIKHLYLPAGNSAEVSAAANQTTIYAVNSLQELLDHLTCGPDNYSRLAPVKASRLPPREIKPETDFADIKGQAHAKRALLIAAASSHNVLMIGPPGTGKTLLARAMAGILPPLDTAESHVVTSLYSIAGQLPAGQGLISRRPFRSPHHGASSVALVGGGAHPKPGEVSLAHAGVLFLDELPEFPRAVLDQLRQPIEDGVVTISRAADTLEFPARSQLIAAMNPCKCGYVGSTRKECRCAPGDIIRYQQKVSGPLLDRFDLHVLVADIPIDELLSDVASHSADEMSPSEATDNGQLSTARHDKSGFSINARHQGELSEERKSINAKTSVGSEAMTSAAATKLSKIPAALPAASKAISPSADEFTSLNMAKQAQSARRRAVARQGKTNSELTPKEVQAICRIEEDSKNLLYQAESRFNLSGRGVHRLLKVSRTIADLDSAANIHVRHLAEALQYREQLHQALPEFI